MTEETRAVAARAEPTKVVNSGHFANLLDSDKFAHIQRLGKMFANSDMVPVHFKGKEADCAIVCEMAIRLEVHPFSMFQSLYMVGNKPGMEAKMAIALINSSGLYRGPLQFKLEGEGMERKCTAIATDKASGQICEAVCTMQIARAEGWIDKNGSKWKTMPDMMLQYRAASFFGRLYCPQVLFGMQTKEELEDLPEKDVTPAREGDEPKRNSLKEKLGINEQKAARAAAIDGEAKVVAEAPTATMVGAPETPGAEYTQAAQEVMQPAQEPEPPFPVNTLCSMMKKARTPEAVAGVDDILRNLAYSDEDRAAVNKWRPTLSS